MAPAQTSWTLITNHGAVLLWLAAHPRATMREVAEGVGVTERQVLRIVRDLTTGRMLTVVREGRSNVYSLNQETPLRHLLFSHLPLQKLLESLHIIGPTADEGPPRQFAT
jgi:DNA-binding transcriptional ArsR family regulator